MRILLIALFLVLGIVYSNRIVAQQIHIDCDTAHFHYSEYIDSMAFYEKRMGEKKHLNTRDERLTLAFYVALSHYPELHDKRISLRLKSSCKYHAGASKSQFYHQEKKQKSHTAFLSMIIQSLPESIIRTSASMHWSVGLGTNLHTSSTTPR